MKKEVLEGKLFVNEQTISELAKAYETPLHPSNEQYASSCLPDKNGYGDESWYGGIKNISQAKSILDNGWAEGAEKALALKDLIMEEPENIPRVKSKRRKQVWKDDGETLDIDRALTGQWDLAYRSTYKEPIDGHSNCVTLTAGWGGNCNMTSEQLFWSGAVMLVVSDILEFAGRSVRLNAICKSDVPGGHYGIQKVIMKDHGEPLRADALAGVICHAGIFRTYGFRLICQIPWNVGYGLGRCIEWSELDPILKKVKYEHEPNCIIVNDCYSKDAAITEIKRILKQFVE